VPGTDPALLATAVSSALFTRADAVVVAAADDPAAQQRGAALAADAHVPMLLAGDPAAAEVQRLGAQRVLTVGPGALAWARERFTGSGPRVVPEAAHGPAPSAPSSARPGRGASSTLLLTTGDPQQAAAVATAQAAGAAVRAVPGADPRGDGDLVADLGTHRPAHVVALGDAFGPQERLDARLATAETGVQVPGGGQLPLQHRRLVSLYGHPGTASLGVLGEQPVDAAIARAKQVAATYDGLGGLPAVPAFEIIATTASGAPGKDGDYSNESAVADLLPWVDAAQRAGVAVVLDLQPGRSDFLPQAKQYAELLQRPNVGLALDAEWHLEGDQRPLQQIGSVGIGDVNATAAWLADLTRTNHLPQKIFLLHQFRLSMIRDRDQLDTSHDELAVVIHADGNGTPSLKMGTWQAMTASPPPNVSWGWKNFYDEDHPTFTPQQTVAVVPSPVFVSYQ
jgi:hypothetical protein